MEFLLLTRIGQGNLRICDFNGPEKCYLFEVDFLDCFIRYRFYANYIF